MIKIRFLDAVLLMNVQMNVFPLKRVCLFNCVLILYLSFMYIMFFKFLLVTENKAGETILFHKCIV